MGHVGLASMSGCFDTCNPKKQPYPQPPKPNLMKLELEIIELLETGKTIKLKTLNLSNNLIKLIPEAIGSFKNLNSLNLGNKNTVQVNFLDYLS